MFKSKLKSKVESVRYEGKQVILCHYTFYRGLVMFTIHLSILPGLQVLDDSGHFPEQERSLSVKRYERVIVSEYHSSSRSVQV